MRICVNSCMEGFEELKLKPGPNYSSFLDELPPEFQEGVFKFRGNLINDSLQHRGVAKSTIYTFLENLLIHLNERLGDLDKIGVFNVPYP